VCSQWLKKGGYSAEQACSVEILLMSRPPKNPLRPLFPEERAQLQQLSRSQAAPASQVTRAKVLLAVDEGLSYSAAARHVGRTSGDAVAHLVARFNQEGVAAVVPGHGGGPPVQYTPAQREQILALVRRTPSREEDGTATWSLTTLQRALRAQGLPRVSTHTIWCVLQEAGLSWQHSRTWCQTGVVQRRRKNGSATVQDPDAEAKKS
jgi:transposase